MKKAVIILSQRLLREEFYSRLDQGIKTYFKEKCDYIALLSESASDKNVKILIDKGISYDSILLEKTSKDTIGEAYLTKKNILLPNQITKAYVVSSDYHIEYRGRIIFDYIFGEDICIEFIGIKTDKIKDKKVINDQLNSLQYFMDLKERSGADDLLLEHPLYGEGL
jgi:hypothetical protein